MKRFFCTVSAAVILVPAASQAETLADALSIAYASNPTLQSQRAQLRALDEDYVQARAGYRPTVSISAETDFSKTYLSPYSGPPTSQSNVATLSATQVLYDSGRTAAQVSQAEASIFAGREQLRQSEAQILLGVVEAYAAVLRDQQALAIQQDSINDFQAQIDLTTARTTAGAGTKTDVAEAQAQLQTAKIAYASAQAQLYTSRSSYIELVGAAPGQLAPLPSLPGMPTTIQQAFDTALDDNPSLLQAVFTERASRAHVEAAKSGFLPQLSADASYAITKQFGQAPATSGLTGRVIISQPLINGGQLRSQLRQAEAANDSDRNLVTAAERSVNTAVSQAWNQLLIARDQVSQAEEGVRVGQVAAEGARIEFTAGLRSDYEVLNEEQQLRTLQNTVVQAKYAEYASTAELLSAMGHMDIAYLVGSAPVYDPKAHFNRVRNSGEVPGLEQVLSTIDQVRPGYKPGDPKPLAEASQPVMNAAQTPEPQGVLTDSRTDTPPPSQEDPTATAMLKK